MIIFNPWLWLILVAGLVVLAAVIWHFHGLGHVIQAERARESFHLQHERLERLVLDQASQSGVPRGLNWVSCTFAPDPQFVWDRHKHCVAALAGATIQFEAIAGGDMEGLPAVDLPKQGTAVLNFVRGEWVASGKIVFNLTPHDVLERFGTGYDALPPPAHRPKKL